MVWRKIRPRRPEYGQCAGGGLDGTMRTGRHADAAGVARAACRAAGPLQRPRPPLALPRRGPRCAAPGVPLRAQPRCCWDVPAGGIARWASGWRCGCGAGGHPAASCHSQGVPAHQASMHASRRTRPNTSHPIESSPGPLTQRRSIAAVQKDTGHCNIGLHLTARAAPVHDQAPACVDACQWPKHDSAPPAPAYAAPHSLNMYTRFFSEDCGD